MHYKYLPTSLAMAIVSLLLNACSVVGGPDSEQVKQFRQRQQAQAEQSNKIKQKQQAATQKRNMSPDCKERLSRADKMMTKDASGRVTHIKVSATGYGAAPKNYYPEAQRRLMTMRAARVDAFRALAEVVGGLHIWGGSALADMVIEQDRYRSFVDSYVRGARIIALNEQKDGTFEASVEMTVDANFLTQVLAFIDPMLAGCLNEQELTQTVQSNAGVSSSLYYSE